MHQGRQTTVSMRARESEQGRASRDNDDCGLRTRGGGEKARKGGEEKEQRDAAWQADNKKKKKTQKKGWSDHAFLV